MAGDKRCPQCGAELPPGSLEGLCPKCLMAAGLESGAATVESPLRASGAATSPDSTRFVPPTAASLASHFPQLEILELLGHGGMGAVYKARQKNLDRLVALKIIRPEAADTPAFAERFNREARMLARLNHPQIVAIYDFGEVSVSDAGGGSRPPRRLYFFLMEYVDGSSLRQQMRSGDLTPDQALKIVPQICDALQYAHDEGIVHRDIKPENILLDKRGWVKIADFGLAKLAAGSSSDYTLTATHHVLGTLRYMAPEQMEGSHAVDHRADIYSLGVVFYEMLTREVPAGHFEPPSRKVQVDVRLDEVVLRALAREPERRYQHASDVKDEVESICKLPPTEKSWAQSGEARLKLQSLLAPAVGMLAIGTALTVWLALAIAGRLPSGFEDWWVVGLGGPLLLLGGIAMSGGRSYWLALAASLVCMAIGFATLYFIFFVPFVPLAALLVGGYSLWRLMQPDVQEAFGQRSTSGGAFRRRRLVITVTLVLPMLALVCAAPLFIAQFGETPQQLARRDDATRLEGRVAALPPYAPEPAPPGNETDVYVAIGGPPEVPDEPDRPAPARSEIFDVTSSHNWIMGPDGPRLDDRFARLSLQLDPTQTDQVNRILQTAYLDYLAIEAQHVERQEVNSKRVIITIRPHPEAVAESEDNLWSQLDAILDSKQQRIARLNLHLDPRESRVGVPLADLVKPGFFGWGKSGAKIEIWRVGTWYHWKVATRDREYDTEKYDAPAPQLPEELRRFWNEPVHAGELSAEPEKNQ
jgi:tRNA A-37 threonylcarbamoyl transferase component Bud32